MAGQQGGHDRSVMGLSVLHHDNVYNKSKFLQIVGYEVW